MSKRAATTQRASKYFKAEEGNSAKCEMSKKLLGKFFENDCEKVAKALLGKFLVRRIGEKRITCKIVEVESYFASEDKASHSYNGQTRRNEAMFMKPGTLYVYVTYGMYHCTNISCGGPGDAVLIRAVEPITNTQIMTQCRSKHSKSAKEIVGTNISNGPSKLCQALHIEKSMDKLNLMTSDELWLENGDAVPEEQIVCCKRIGLSKRSGVWQNKPFRFYIKGNKFVSVRDKPAEST
ncbi:DNA-3-methyladenine glycosylase-like isoform X1 [Clavelina lepadiformis]|uniref:DNA-3-methyladenine glycosylase-like isoform X1 n=1 Tax=Clavelina lepadiformis TaxID=159417 RepID=UPI00404328D2